MSRGARGAQPASGRARLKLDFARAAPLRILYPQLAEVRIEFEFQDGRSPRPSPQSFAYYPSARGFFRYPCPCHVCSGEFDLSNDVARLAEKLERMPRSRIVTVSCSGERPNQASVRAPCPVSAQVRLSATLRGPE